MKMKILNHSILKWIALFSMLIDHIGAIFGLLSFASWNLSWLYTFFRIIGRLAFPIFAFFISEGWRYTRNRKKYFFLIVIFAVLSQPIYYFALNTSRFSLNIFFTFIFSMILLFLVDKMRMNKSTAFINSILIFDIVLLVVLLNAIGVSVSYGLYGIVLPVVFYLFYHTSFGKRIWMWAIVAVMIILFWLRGFVLIDDITMNSFTELFALISIPLLCLYSGEKGKLGCKWLFYIFYPVHIMLIYLISLLI